MEPIPVRDGKALVDISGALSLDQVREAMQHIAEAYAKLSGVRGPNGLPILAGPTTKLFTKPLSNGLVLLAHEIDMFACWVGAIIAPEDMLRLVGELATKAADVLEAEDAKNTPASAKH